MNKWTRISDNKTLSVVLNSLKSNGIEALIIENKEEAKKKVLELIPKGAEVFTATSMTLDEIGILPEINESGDYDSVRNKLNSMNRTTQGEEMQKLGASPDWVIGSVHAITQNGEILIASNTGSQLSSYVYGSSHVIWVVGAQKIVKDIPEGEKRLYEYTLPLESERVKKAYGMPHSAVNKLLIISREVRPHRITILIVKQVLGF